MINYADCHRNNIQCLFMFRLHYFTLIRLTRTSRFLVSISKARRQKDVARAKVSNSRGPTITFKLTGSRWSGLQPRTSGLQSRHHFTGRPEDRMSNTLRGTKAWDQPRWTRTRARSLKVHSAADALGEQSWLLRFWRDCKSVSFRIKESEANIFWLTNS